MAEREEEETVKRIRKPIRWWAVYDERGRFVTARPTRMDAIEDASCNMRHRDAWWRAVRRIGWRCTRVRLVEE